MKQSVRAALFSALIFPGAGHFLLKKYLVGTVLGATALVPIYLVTVNAVKRAQEIVDQILLGEVEPDILTIMGLVSKQSASSDPRALNIALFVLFLAWIVGIVDAYRLGRLSDQADSKDV